MKNMPVMKEICKDYGIDIDLLLEEKVIANETCFWCLLQSQTDRLNHYYYDEDSRIKKALSHPRRSYLPNESALFTLTSIRNQVIWLMKFVLYNVKLFARSVSAFDDFHHLDTFDKEMAYFKETYMFIDGHGIHMILNLIDEVVLKIAANTLQEDKSLQKDGESNFSEAHRRRSIKLKRQVQRERVLKKKRSRSRSGINILRKLLRMNRS